MPARTSLKPLPHARHAEAPPARPKPGGRRFGGRLFKRAGREVRRLLPAWLYFFLSFSLLRLTQTAILGEYGVAVIPPSRVLAGSLIVAKALLTVDSFKLFGKLEGRPVIIAALFKTLAYGLLVFVFEYFDVLFEWRFQGLTAGSLEFARRLASPRFWIIQVWLVVLLFAYSGIRTLAGRLGHRRFRRLFIGR